GLTSPWDIKPLATWTNEVWKIDDGVDYPRLTNVVLPMDGNEGDSHNATIQVYRDGTRMISYRDGDLFNHKLENGVWQREGELFLSGLNGNTTHCFITEDEQTMFLASDFMSNGLQLDLFIFRKDTAGNWGLPEAIDELNTDFDEDSPFLASNGTLYFSSRGHNSMGGFDIFQSTYDSINQKWSKPENLGHPINTVAEDTYFNMDGKVGYLSSTREGGYGSLDIYRVFFFNKVSVAGRLLDGGNNPVANAEVNIDYESTSLKTYTDEDGSYELLVPIFKDMKLTFEKDQRQLHEGEYLAHVFFKDKNDNSYDLYFENTADLNLLDGPLTKVQHININVRNDYSENLILETVPQSLEAAWADSLNRLDSVMFVNGLDGREEAVKFIKETARVSSENLRIKDVVIIKKVEEPEENLFAEIEKEKEDEVEIDDKLFTVQILTLTIPNVPPPFYFDQIEAQSVVFHAKGADGLDRFYTGSYETKRDAKRAMMELRKLGYSDAFVRKIKKYKEFEEGS
ncbi:MAG: carboxypeptidase regulatory-like domain-containing protein, partial [Ekhidna sp.]|nr:carboxypeptidase regulatory-like domain-containing protein [Ekhidna sp.]